MCLVMNDQDNDSFIQNLGSLDSITVTRNPLIDKEALIEK